MKLSSILILYAFLSWKAEGHLDHPQSNGRRKSSKSGKSGKNGKGGKKENAGKSKSGKGSKIYSGKSGKGRKSSKSRMSRSSNDSGTHSLQSGRLDAGDYHKILCATMNEPYPGYNGTIRTSGYVSVTFPGMDMTEFSFDLQGLESECEDCGIHIHFGTSCVVAEEVGDHYYSDEVGVDPWTTEGGAVYNTDTSGSAMGYFILTSGFDSYSENIGRAVVIHAADGERLTCALLRSSEYGKCEADHPTADSRTLYAYANDPYPGYTGTIDVSGSFMVTFPSVDLLKFSYDLQGLETNCQNCGVHIHAGTTCDNADEVGDHYYTIDVDPWTSEGGAVYNSDENGYAKGSFTLTTGVDTYEDNIGHAVVVHAADSTRLSCGLLKQKRLR